MNNQFISRNQLELVKVLTTFRELTALYQENLCLYLDKDHWELFDTRVCRTIFRHKFKNVNQFINDMNMFQNAIINCALMYIKPNNKSVTYSLRFLSKYYKSHELIYFTHGKK